MELTDQLLDEAVQTPDQPMPVVFHLTSWAVGQRPLAAWLVDELYKLYGVPRRLGQAWVDTDQVIPLLDGLDEVAAEHRDACAAAINTFHAEHGLSPLAVCSRITEYEALQAKLQLRGAIVIQPLSLVEVDRYLRQVGRPLAAVRAATRDDEQLADLLTTPLFLSIVALTYKGKTAGLVRATGNLEERRQRVLAEYITAMLTRPRPSTESQPYTSERTVRWLAWLGAAMGAHRESVFYLDWMQPDWLPTLMQRRFVTVGSAVLAGLGFTLISGLISAVTSLSIYGLVDGFLVGFGLGFGLLLGSWVGIVAHDPTITPTERLRWTTAYLPWQFRGWFVRGWVGGLGAWIILYGAAGLIVGLIWGLFRQEGTSGLGGLVPGMVGGMLLGPPIGLLFGLISGLEPQSYVTRPAPGKALQVSKRNALLIGLPVGLGLGLIGGLGVGLAVGAIAGNKDSGLGSGLITGIIVMAVGALFGVQRGGGAYLRHYILRWLLTRNGSIPRRYVAFLDYATQLILLRRRGGGYEFVHPLLREHFAALGPDLWRAYASGEVS